MQKTQKKKLLDYCKDKLTNKNKITSKEIIIGVIILTLIKSASCEGPGTGRSEGTGSEPGTGVRGGGTAGGGIIGEDGRFLLTVIFLLRGCDKSSPEETSVWCSEGVGRGEA